MQENLATNLEKVKVSSARAAAMEKERNAVTTKYEDLLSSLEQRVGFAGKEMVC